MERRVREVLQDLGEFLTVVEVVASREEIRGGDEILSGGNDGLAVSRGDKIVLDRHQFGRFCSCFFGLRHIWGGTSYVSERMPEAAS